jgi:hypothetical protein
MAVDTPREFTGFSTKGQYPKIGINGAVKQHHVNGSSVTEQLYGGLLKEKKDIERYLERPKSPTRANNIRVEKDNTES